MDLQIAEIQSSDLDWRDVVGKGAFGVVRKVIWRGRAVAAKQMEDADRKSLFAELVQLSRVHHPNIIELFGANTKTPPFFLLMELAELGSLYNILHGKINGETLNYSLGLALSWCLQCARGVAYLHGFKPKSILHRDLKPPNLLVFNHGLVVKICDFGTACTQKTMMTSNRGSAAWMAPEVFEGKQYSDRCDVYSWGIVLWEVLSRRRPFQDVGGPYRVLWAVHEGKRPPLVKGCPTLLEQLMVSCWDANQNERPTMEQVVSILEYFIKFGPGANDSLVIPNPRETLTSSLRSDAAASMNQPQTSGQFSNLSMAQSSQQQQMPMGLPAAAQNSLRAGATGSIRGLDEVLEDDALAPALDEPPLRPPQRSIIAPRQPAQVTTRPIPVNANRTKERRSFDNSEVPLDLLPPAASGTEVADASHPPSGRLNRGHARTGSDGNYLASQAATRAQPTFGDQQPPNASEVGLPRSSAARIDALRNEYRLRVNIPGLNPDALNAILNDIEEECWPLEPHPLVLAAAEAMASDSPSVPHIDPAIVHEQRQTHQRHVALFREYLRVRLESALLLQRKYELTQQLQQQQQRQHTPSGSALADAPRPGNEAPASLQIGALLSMSPAARRQQLGAQYGRLLNENEDLKRQQKDMLAELEMFREQPQQQA